MEFASDTFPCSFAREVSSVFVTFFTEQSRGKLSPVLTQKAVFVPRCAP